VNTVAILGRMLLALVLVLGVMWLLARWARKPMGGKADRVMAVLARQQLSRTSSVTVLRVMDRALVLGVTEQGVQLITETELSAIEDALATDADQGRGWSRLRMTPAGAAAGEDAADSGSEPSGLPELSALSGRPAGRRRQLSAGAGGFDGSVLSPRTWRQLVSAARELTVRR
jgi:flagellar protein FliO/FliZ